MHELEEPFEDTQANFPLQTGWRTCPQCKVTFLCGIANGDEACWCFSLPQVLSFEGKGTGSATGCMCPNCIQQHISKKMQG